MFRPLAVNIGLRYANSRGSFVSFISVVAIVGLVLSVAVLLLVTSVMNGFERELRDRILGVVPHVLLRGRAPLQDFDQLSNELVGASGIRGVAPYVEGTGLVAANSAVRGVAIVGIDPMRQASVSDLPNYLIAGKLADLGEQRFGVIVGKPLALALDVGVGDRVMVVLPEGSVTVVGLVPRQKRLTVVGIFETHSELDARSVYIALDDARRLFRLGSAFHGLQLKTADVFAADLVSEDAVARVGPDRVHGVTWMRQHGNLYRAIAFQRAMMFLLLSLLVAVAAFNLVSALVMVVNQRRGDVAVLRTLGGDGRTIVMSFVTLGTTIGVVGVTLGVVLGATASLLVEDGYRWLEGSLGMSLMSQYFITYLPSDLRLADIGLVATIAIGLCITSALYPAVRASLLQPADVLRHE